VTISGIHFLKSKSGHTELAQSLAEIPRAFVWPPYKRGIFVPLFAKACPARASAAGTGELCRRTGRGEISLRVMKGANVMWFDLG